MSEAEEECEPCKVGVLLGIGKYVCEQNLSGDDKKECDDLYEKCVVGEISVKDFIEAIKTKVTDPQDLKTLDSVSEVADKFDLTPEKVREVTESLASAPAQ